MVGCTIIILPVVFADHSHHHHFPLVGLNSPLVGLPILHNEAHTHALFARHQSYFDDPSSWTQPYFNTPCSSSNFQTRKHYCQLSLLSLLLPDEDFLGVFHCWVNARLFWFPPSPAFCFSPPPRARLDGKAAAAKSSNWPWCSSSSFERKEELFPPLSLFSPALSHLSKDYNREQ